MDIKHVYTVGKDELGDWDFNDDRVPSDVVWCAYAYKNEGYEGHGTMLLRWKDGTYSFHGLSHCSCNGPTEGVREHDRKHLTKKEIKALHGKDENGKDIDVGEYRDYDLMSDLWKAYDKAIKKEKR